jgi:DNA-binding response OmpR family regulator
LSLLKLLYIEDDIDIQTIYAEQLKTLVPTLYFAKDGEEGFERYLELKPHIILLDINMPKMDGLTLAKRIREIDRHVKIIITTSYSEQEKLLQAIELYLIKYIIKPIEPHILEEAITKAIEEIREEQGEQRQKLFLLDSETVWDQKEEKLLKNNQEIKLTKNERRLLSLLSSDKSKVFTFFEIFNHLSYDDFDKEYDANQIRALVKLVRKKIPKDAIINIYGEGYRFNPLNG